MKSTFAGVDLEHWREDMFLSPVIASSIELSYDCLVGRQEFVQTSRRSHLVQNSGTILRVERPPYETRLQRQTVVYLERNR